MNTPKTTKESGSSDNYAWMFDLGFKLDRLNKNLERQIRIWSPWAVLFRAVLNSIGYLVGLAVLAAVLAILASRYLDFPVIGDLIRNIRQALETRQPG